MSAYGVQDSKTGLDFPEKCELKHVSESGHLKVHVEIGGGASGSGGGRLGSGCLGFGAKIQWGQ